MYLLIVSGGLNRWKSQGFQQFVITQPTKFQRISPRIDASMRELWQTGWCQQNIRMAAASFLIEYCPLGFVVSNEWEGLGFGIEINDSFKRDIKKSIIKLIEKQRNIKNMCFK